MRSLPLEKNEKSRLVEALILGSPEPVTLARLVDLVPRVKPAQAAEELARHMDVFHSVR